MENLSRCKVCGYIMPTDKIPDVCPACGVDKKVFEPYTSKMSDERYKFLSFHIHPIILHFPQAFVVTALGLLILLILPFIPFKNELLIVTKFNLLFLPLTVLMGAFSGMKDGQMRFKKITTPLLKFKIYLSIGFFILSVIAAVVIFLSPFTMLINILLILITGAASGVAVILGRAGAPLMESYMPGK